MIDSIISIVEAYEPMRNAIVLAAGKGTRMHSDVPKVLHEVCGVPMVELIVNTLKQAGAERVVTVTGFGHEMVESCLEGQCEFALQEPQLGTGHAVMQAKQLEGESGITVVVNGDVPCIRQETFEKLFLSCEEADMVVLTVKLEDPKAYGRIVREKDGSVQKIVEYKDCSEEEKTIKEINTGIYAFKNELLFTHGKEIKNDNAQQEYYITDLVELFKQAGHVVQAVEIEDPFEVQGVNDNVELAKANATMRKRINESWMRKGVTMVNPDATYIGPYVTFGKDVVLHPNVYLYGKTSIKDGTTILPQSYLDNAIIGSRTIINASEITDSEVKDDCKIGPYTHFRNGCIVEDKNRVGNFVEFKNVHFGVDSRCAHLTYLGDSDVGSKVNIGCGVITVNYDGANKYHTTIKDGAFVGSNSNLIAPVTIGENAVVAAGSTATIDVPDGDMAISRVRQENKEGYGKFYLERNRKKKAESKK